jgi:hypothetical protein
MKPLFNAVKVEAPKRNLFDMSYEKKLSCNMGELVPFMCQEILPGDKFNVSDEMLVRLAPMIAPMMHRVNIYKHYFFVPNRLTWDNWQNFITGGPDGTLAYNHPLMPLTEATKANWGVGSLADFLGIPVPQTGTLANTVNVNALPFRAYQTIWNEYYRDQTLQTAATVNHTDGMETGAGLTDAWVLRKRCWEKDYFTSSLPWTQRGAAVSLPNTPLFRNPPVFTSGADPGTGIAIQTIAGNPWGIKPAGGGQVTKIDNITGIDISIINLRRATRLQTWLEKNAVAGSRYIEQLLVHWGVKSSDARLQRPEYLGGGKQPVVISEVVSMVKEATNPQGTLAGHGISAGAGAGFSRYFEEHGWVIGIMSVMPRTAYQQGLPKQFIKGDKFDYAWPELAHIGEQAVLNQELYTEWITTDHNVETFGYMPRYSEYKFNNSTVHGDFKTTLNFWHMGRIFSSLPALNAAFVTADVQGQGCYRTFAVNDGSDHLWIQLYCRVKALRPLPMWGTPML